MKEDDRLLYFEKNELFEHFIYRHIAAKMKNPKNRKLIMEISSDELRHYNFWKQRLKRDVKLSRMKIFLYSLLFSLLGVYFAIKYMSQKERRAQHNYKDTISHIPGAKRLIKDETKHERHLVSMLDEDWLNYLGSMTAGLNNALVDMIGALAGFTLSLGNTRLIGIVGLILGATTSVSVGASEYLETDIEGARKKKPLKAALYTTSSYVVTGLLLILPYFFFDNIYVALVISILTTILLSLFLTFYLSVVRVSHFRKRFYEMVLLSLGVAVVSFFIGFLIKFLLGIEIY